ncbi:hypothetical protein GCM10010485_46890 [Streptosporangium carneum]
MHGEDLSRDEPGGEFVHGLGEGFGEGLLVDGHVVQEPGRQAGDREDHPVVGEHLAVVVEPRHGVASLQSRQEVTAEGGQRRLALVAPPYDQGGLALVVGDPVQDEVLLRGEVLEQRRLGDSRGRRHLRDGHLVESPLEEQGDRRGGYRLVDLLSLALPESRHPFNLTDTQPG